VLLQQRPYTPIVPAAYDATKTWPVLLVLGGYGASSSDTANWMGFTSLQDVFIVAPDANLDSHNLPAWNPGVLHWPQFDVEYLTAIIHDLAAHYSIDRKRVFVAGHSLGAHMAHRMACDAAGEVAAIVSLAGQVLMDPKACAPAQPVSVLQVHGTADAVIGYDGDVQNEPPDPNIPSAHQTIAVWARNDGCGALLQSTLTLDLDSSLAGEETTVETYAGCPANVDVQLWSIQGGSHRPQLTPQFASDAWAFLSAHQRL
jgi:polyhydroxybutyrate depolymerase